MNFGTRWFELGRQQFDHVEDAHALAPIQAMFDQDEIRSILLRHRRCSVMRWVNTARSFSATHTATPSAFGARECKREKRPKRWI